MDDPITSLSNAIGHACYKGFSEHTYTARNWEKYDTWKRNVYMKWSQEEQNAAHEQEQETGVPMGGADFRITKTREHSPFDIEVDAMFSQTWSSTALGFGGVGGQAITDAYTIVLRSELNGEHCVYFGGRFAYRIDRANQKFFEDVHNRVMAKRAEAKGLYET